MWYIFSFLQNSRTWWDAHIWLNQHEPDYCNSIRRILSNTGLFPHCCVPLTMPVNPVDTEDLKRHKGDQKEWFEGPALVLPTLSGVCESEWEERFCWSQRVACNCLNAIFTNFQQLKMWQYNEVLYMDNRYIRYMIYERVADNKKGSAYCTKLVSNKTQF